MEKKAVKLLDNAVKKLNEANQELYRPEEDVVSYVVCKNAQFAIESFLKGFLMKNGIDPGNDKTIDSLYAQCKAINKNFEGIDLSGFECTTHLIDTKYCYETTKVSRCFHVAQSLDTFFREEKIIN
ncbi:MAG: HEPN domain-containing protein [Maribacter sp.]|nr:HEPN domain-containing protein [Maribacter sp.]